MDPASFGLTIVGLAGLFSTCMDIVDKVDSYRGASVEALELKAQFDAEKLLLQRWAERVGFTRDGNAWKLQDQHHPSLDHAETAATVRTHLEMIADICKKADAPSFFLNKPSDGTANGGGKSSGRMSKVAARLLWSMKGKDRSTMRVRLFHIFVVNLEALIPGDGNGSRSNLDLINSLGEKIMVSCYSFRLY